MPRKPKAEKEFKLEDHLILAQTIASKIGISDISEITRFVEDSEGYEDDGRSRMHHLILQKTGRWKLPDPILQKYDDNIEKHLKKIRKTWGQDLNLKYYQYLAAIFAETYLDHYFRDPKKFKTILNTWNKNRGSDESIPRSKITNKIAYWMATGSGKTLIMHLNLLQFLEYNKGSHKLDYENIILVTSDDSMSEQHKKELHQSGIPADLFDGSTGGYFSDSKDKVKIISIHKLKLPGEKTGQGVTIDVSSFGTKNLVFIDEGHKGQKSEDAKWVNVRKKLAEDGFVWEYSATFGQTITSRDSTYFDEYKYSILFDYSYKYFHQDGFGKDFHILNLSTSKFQDQHIPTLLLANTMSYYEQLQIYKKTPELQEYQIENPLWIFVGSKVNKEDSDIHQVVKFLDGLLKADRNEMILNIEKILDGRSGILGPDNRDAFTHHYPEKDFAYLRESSISPETIYQGILTDIFHVKPGASSHKLEVYNIKNAEGEIGLKASSSEKYFGVINIGDKSSFLKVVRETTPEITVREAPLSNSLFKDINIKDSKINLLLGAKKFIEGWNSWRVSNMCLLNIGKNEGPQIIQLFGRGVRLKGLQMSLKRSSHLPGTHPKYIDILETLKIYGIQANYLKQFKDYIEQENIPTYELGIPTSRDHLDPFPDDLYTLTLEKGYSFKQHLFEFSHEAFLDSQDYPTIDLLPKTDIIDSRSTEHLAPIQSKQEHIIDDEILELLDWNEIYHEILEHKITRERHNIHIKKESLKPILVNKRYILFCSPELINPTLFSDLDKTKDIVLLILKACINQYYKKIRLGEENRHVQLTPVLDEANRIPEKYEIKIKTKNEQVVKTVEDIVSNIHDKQYQTRLSGEYIIPAYYSKHLYQPLLSKPEKEEITLKPTGLNEGETQFVRDLERYLKQHPIPGKDVYLLRNLTRGKGVGFFEENSFYPDFILWLKEQQKQKIVFIDPKGILRHSLTDQKLTLHKHLRNEVQPRINQPGVTFDAFILSVSPFNAFYEKVGIRPDKLVKENHLIFMYSVGKRMNEKYMESLFNNILND